MNRYLKSPYIPDPSDPETSPPITNPDDVISEPENPSVLNTTAPGYEFHTCSSRVELDENDLTSVGALDAFTVLYRVKFSDNLDPQLTSVAVSD